MTDQPGESPTAPTAQDELADLAEEFFAAENAYDPFGATLGGIEGYAHEVPDPSRAAALRHREVLRAFGARLAAIPLDGLAGEDRLTHRVLARLIENNSGWITHGLDDFSVSASIVAPHNTVFATFAMTAVDQEGAGAYLERLAGLPGYFDAVMQRSLDAAAEAALAQAAAGYAQWQCILLGQYADPDAFNAVLQSAAQRQGVYATWTVWHWQTDEDTILFAHFLPV